jgi:DNA-binding SARP family transcriptional activator
MTIPCVSLFRGFSATFDDNILNGLGPQKVQELFCYLLIYRDRPHLREQLMTLLWEQSEPTQARKYLRQTLWQLQNLLGTQGEELVLAESDWIQINPQASYWLDVAQFEEAFLGVEGRPGQELKPEEAETLEEATRLYEGDLLEGWYQDWCLFERERLQNIYLAMLDKLMGYCEAHDKYDEGIRFGMCVLHLDRARERTHRRLMRLRYLAGDRTGALRQYDRCLETLHQELNVEPSWRTKEILRQIIDDALTGSTLPSHNSSKGGLLPYLTHLHTTLEEAQKRVQDEIELIKMVLDERRLP